LGAKVLKEKDHVVVVEVKGVKIEEVHVNRKVKIQKQRAF